MPTDEPIQEGQALPPSDHPIWEGRDTAYLGEVVPTGATTPVEVLLDGREGNVVFVRRRDPGEATNRAPVHPGDRVVLMTAVSHASLAITSEVGRKDDLLTAMRVIPTRRSKGHVYGRVLRYGEKDTGRRVHLRPGDNFTLSGKKITTLDLVDSWARPQEFGYAPITDTVWTWFTIVHIPDSEARRYVLAVARRLDSAHRRFVRVRQLREEIGAMTEQDPGPRIRALLFELIGEMESAVVAIGRAVDMVAGAPSSLSLATPPVPRSVTIRRDTIREFRNAYEHIDDRALGRVRGQPNPTALTIFDQHQLLERNRLRYGSHSLHLERDIGILFRQCRRYVKQLTGRCSVLSNYPVQTAGP